LLALSGVTSTHITVLDKIRNIDFVFAFEYAKPFIRLAIKKFSLEAQNPELKLKDVQSRVNVSAENVDTAGFRIETGASFLRSQLQIQNLPEPMIDIMFEAKRLSFTEIRRFITGFALERKIPRVVLNADAHGDRLNFQAALSHFDSHLNFTGELVSTAQRTTYELEGNIHHLNLH
jgi:hypothetical protein